MKIGKNRAIMIAKKLYEEMIYEISLNEGNQMSLIQTINTLSGTIPKGVRTKDVLIVESIQQGLDYVLDKVISDNFYFDKETLCMINRLVAKNDNFDNLGGFRKYGIRISGTKHKGLEVKDFDYEFFNLLNKYHSEGKDIIKEIDLMLDLCKNQFFGDGNKRTSQLMMCGLLIKKGYAPFVVNFRDEKYLSLLISYYENDNKKEDIKKALLEKQKEVEYDFLTPEERDKVISIKKEDLER